MTDVHEGQDGWLFLTGGSNQVLRFYTELDFFSDANARAWAALLRARAGRLSGLCYRHLLVPDKISVLAPWFGGDLPNFARHPLRQLRALAEEYELQDTLLDCTKMLAVEPGPFHSFYKTDSHWTIWGAYLAYTLVCRDVGLAQEAIASFADRQFAKWPVQFDLGSKLDPARSEDQIFTPIRGAVRRIYANGIVLAREKADANGAPSPLHHGCHIVFENTEAPVSEKIVIFGDSFADYRPSTFTAFFSETFRETHFVWSTSLDYGYIEQIKPAYVVSEMAERFVTHLPDDTYDVRRDAEQRLAAYFAAF